MKNFETVNLSTKNAIAFIGLSRPNFINSINIQMRDDLFEALSAVKDDPNMRGVIFYGKGPKGFCSGADLNDFGMFPSQNIARKVKQQRDIWKLILNLEKPTLAAIHGFCFGAGLELASFCDIRIATTDSLFAMPEVQLGLMPAGGGTQTLPRVLVLSHSLNLLLSGNQINSHLAYSHGLVSRVVDKGDLMAEAEKVLGQILCCPDSLIKACKNAVINGLDMPTMNSLAFESRLNSLNEW